MTRNLRPLRRQFSSSAWHARADANGDSRMGRVSWFGRKNTPVSEVCAAINEGERKVTKATAEVGDFGLVAVRTRHQPQPVWVLEADLDVRLLADTNDCRAAPKTRRHEAAEVPEHAMADRRGEQACNADEAQLSPPSQVPFIPNRAS